MPDNKKDQSDFSLQERNFAQEVKKEREVNGWTQEDLAQRMRSLELPYVTQATVSRIENLTRPVRLMEAQAISQIFDRTIVSMTSRDGRESMIRVARGQARIARKHYAQFKEELHWTAYAQLDAKRDLEMLEEIFADGVMDPETKELLDSVVLNLKAFSEIDLMQTASEIIHGVRVNGLLVPEQRNSADG